MFGAIGRWFKALGFMLTGQIDSARRTLDTNPHTVRAKYESIIQDKLNQIQQYKQAVAGLIAQQESKIAKVKTMTVDVERLERMRTGALAKAKQLVAQWQPRGKPKDEIQAMPDYQKCLGAFNDFTATLAEKQEHIAELERDIEEFRKGIANHKVQLQQLVRDVEKIKSESHEAVADIITAKQERELADMINGLSTDGSSQELQRLRQMRQQLKAEARISKELAGTDSKAQEAEFLEFARQASASTEFDSLVGLSDAPPASPESSKERGGALPE